MADPLDPSVTEALRSLRVQMSSGIDIGAALETAGTVCRGWGSQDAFQRAARAAQNGDGFHAVVEHLRDYVTDGERAVLHAGFKAGRADECIDAVVEQRELWYRSRSEIRSGMMLPLFVLVIASFVAPLPAFFAENGNGFTYLLSACIPLGMAFLLWQIARHFMQTRTRQGTQGPSGFDSLLLNIPVVKMVEQRRNLSEFASLMSLQLGAGVAITEALDVCSRCMPNGNYRLEAQRLAQIARQGSPLSSGLKPGELWPMEFIAALVAGEKSGQLDDTLKRYSNHAREAYTRAIKEFAQWLPRVVYGVIALFVIYNIFTIFGRIGAMYKEVL